MATHSFSLLSIPSSTSTSYNRQSDNNTLTQKYCKILATSFTGGMLSIRPQNLNVFTLKRRRSTEATVSFSLPTAKPERAPSEIQPKWSARAIKAFAMAELEARKLKYPNTGTEALLMGILVEGTSLAAKFLRANGVTLLKARDETVKLLGKSDMYFFSPEHPPLTEPAQRALNCGGRADDVVVKVVQDVRLIDGGGGGSNGVQWKCMVKHNRKANDANIELKILSQAHLSGDTWQASSDIQTLLYMYFVMKYDLVIIFAGESGEITIAHLALGIWSEKESAGHKIMATLGFDDEKAKELARSMDKDIEMSYK
ncbi:ATP-dependent Clp protease ATP-binding subunit CLPT1, chloroplastic-like [Nicotiana tabacum]|uniref:ATP-dependent Clp protease ATP-binding subunit CLPT1, chloroplastic-like n=1 Tax=Nicotiana tabacum TaxID=4097 RepID=A0AC58UBY8_TOBAC